MALESLRVAAHAVCTRIQSVVPEQSIVHAEVRAECRALLDEVAEAEAFVAALTRSDASPSQATGRAPLSRRKQYDAFMYAVPKRFQNGQQHFQLPDVDGYSRQSSASSQLSPVGYTSQLHFNAASSLRSSMLADSVGERRGDSVHSEQPSPGLKVLGQEIAQDEAAFSPKANIEALAQAESSMTEPRHTAQHTPAAHAVDHSVRMPTQPVPRRAKNGAVVQPSPLQSLSPSLENAKSAVLPDVMSGVGLADGMAHFQLPDVSIVVDDNAVV